MTMKTTRKFAGALLGIAVLLGATMSPAHAYTPKPGEGWNRSHAPRNPIVRDYRDKKPARVRAVPGAGVSMADKGPIVRDYRPKEATRVRAKPGAGAPVVDKGPVVRDYRPKKTRVRARPGQS
jgi:hypothetical protein